MENPSQNNELVAKLAASGCTFKDVANYLAITEEEAIKQYSTVYHRAVIDANRAVATQVFMAALEGNMTACTFWLKNIGRWEEYGKNVPKITEDKIIEAININIIEAKDNGKGDKSDSN